LRLAGQRRSLQRRRVISDAILFPDEQLQPKSYTHRNSPVLTADIVRTEYAPILRRRKETSTTGVL
jgi:hypothetical protein